MSFPEVHQLALSIIPAKKGHGSRTVCRSSDWKLELKWNADDRKMEAINRGEAGGDFDVTRSVKCKTDCVQYFCQRVITHSNLCHSLFCSV